jgi:hypothetical protein
MLPIMGMATSIRCPKLGNWIMRLKWYALHVATGVLALTVMGPSLSAQPVDGLAAMHDIRRERGFQCFSDHFHYGSSSGQANKKAAERAAIISWADFVNFEYGSTWTNYRKAGSKSMKCSQSSSGWECNVSARPCR